MSGLYIFSVRIGDDYQTKVFEPDPDQDPNEQGEKTTLLDREEKYHKDLGHHTSVMWIYGMGVDALRKYFNEKENANFNSQEW